MTILIVGDSCIDVFIYGEITRLSPEAPVPVFNPLDKRKMMVWRAMLLIMLRH